MTRECGGKRMGNGIFITGTDTGVGKTFVASGLIRAMNEKGLNVCPMKPVESGCRTVKGSLVPADALALIKAANVDEHIDLINPYRLKNPIAPSVAAEIEGVSIRKSKILSAYKSLSRKYDLTVVEGAGGIMVPVYKKYLFLDLASDLKLPVIIIARPGLGTINHTLLTINAVKGKGLKVLGVIINYAEKIKKGISEKTNPAVIEEIGAVPVLGVVPYLNNKNTDSIFREIAGKIVKAK
jgi:dethiobiotin synthetase